MRARHGFGAACAAALLAAGCGGPASPPKPPVSEKPAGTAGQWLHEDAAGEARLTFRLQAQTIDFVIACRAADKSFLVSAADPSPKGAPPPAPGDAVGVVFGAAAFPAKLAAEETLAAPGRVAARLPVNGDALKALKEAGALRVVYRDAFTATDQDTNGAIEAFAERCAALTGVTPEP
ncbi:MAG: hypothetical protein AB7M12_14005 [Hyphomonadaceae bacterium]